MVDAVSISAHALAMVSDNVDFGEEIVDSGEEIGDLGKEIGDSGEEIGDLDGMVSESIIGVGDLVGVGVFLLNSWC